MNYPYLFLFRCTAILLLQIIGSTTSFQQLNDIRSANKARCLSTRNKSTLLLSSSAASSSSPSSKTPSAEEYTVQLHYENNSCDIQARSNETLLTAFERNQHSLEQKLGLPSHMIPSDCRRGNCLTCTGTHASASSRLSSGTSVICDDDGLSPHMSRTIQEKGYVLTCSTRVIGEGLQLNLGENQKVWKDIYQERFENGPVQDVAWAAMARTKRLSDERNVPRWQKVTEEGIILGDNNDESSESSTTATPSDDK
ncbi:MAG: ferredoxin [Bacillariaceae sp.]|jgi:ferredoxin